MSYSTTFSDDSWAHRDPGLLVTVSAPQHASDEFENLVRDHPRFRRELKAKRLTQLAAVHPEIERAIHKLQARCTVSIVDRRKARGELLPPGFELSISPDSPVGLSLARNQDLCVSESLLGCTIARRLSQSLPCPDRAHEVKRLDFIAQRHNVDILVARSNCLFAEAEDPDRRTAVIGRLSDHRYLSLARLDSERARDALEVRRLIDVGHQPSIAELDLVRGQIAARVDAFSLDQFPVHLVPVAETPSEQSRGIQLADFGASRARRPYVERGITAVVDHYPLVFLNGRVVRPRGMFVCDDAVTF